MRLAFTVATVWTLLTAAAVGQAEFKLTEAPDSCRNAHAVLLASTSENKAAIWSSIRFLAGSDDQKWKVVDDYQPGVARMLSLREYDTTHHQGGTAYVAECGYGGTCNSLAKAWFEKHPDSYSTHVYCGPVPEAISNPRAPSN